MMISEQTMQRLTWIATCYGKDDDTFQISVPVTGLSFQQAVEVSSWCATRQTDWTDDPWEWWFAFDQMMEDAGYPGACEPLAHRPRPVYEADAGWSAIH